MPDNPRSQLLMKIRRMACRNFDTAAEAQQVARDISDLRSQVTDPEERSIVDAEIMILTRMIVAMCEEEGLV